VDCAVNCAEGMELFERTVPDVAFVDIRLPDGSGLDLIPNFRSINPACCIVVITAFGSLDAVMDAVRKQAFEYLLKPIDLEVAESLVREFLHSRNHVWSPHSSGVNPDTELRQGTVGSRVSLIGESPPMQQVFKAIARAAHSGCSLLITGETGTGKEVVARKIHELSERAENPFVAVNCGALPPQLVESELFGYSRGAFTGADSDKPGRFELAQNGTLFLDEIGELPPEAQVKLLRFLDDRKIERLGSVKSIDLNLRVMAATNQPMAALVKNGTFRADLYYRLAVLEIPLPPLREREDDVVLLARYFAEDAELGTDAVGLLRNHSWPGNVRELRNVIEHARTMSGNAPILPMHLPTAVKNANFANSVMAGDGVRDLTGKVLTDELLDQDGLYDKVLAPIEAALIRKVLERHGGNQTAAAEQLGIHRNTLRNKLQELRGR
jgi:DNA-binding NtrC family response regulator